MLIWAAAACGAFGVWLELTRRARHAPGLSGGAYEHLPRMFAATIAFVTLIPLARLLTSGQALILAVPATALGLYGLCGLARMAADGPMRHIFAGFVNLVAHPRPSRFGGGRSADLKAADLLAAPLGAAAATDFSQSQLASFDACVQCGRCEVECPAFAAGLPLNPKKLINDLAENLRGAGATSYAGNGHPGLPTDARPVSGGPIVLRDGHASIEPATIWSCTTCRACVEACPMMIEHVDAIIDVRRALVMRDGAVAPHAQTVLENLRDSDTQGGYDLDARFDWGADLDLGTLDAGTSTEALLWVGESGYDRRAQQTLRSLVRLLKQAGVVVKIIGKGERDCGDQARRLGDEATFQTLARANIATLNNLTFDYILTADPHALHILRNEYPAFGGQYRVRHHTDILAELVETGRLAPKANLPGKITYHDPCYLGRYNGEFSASRKILSAISDNFIEMERSGPRSHCCGGGGGAPLTDVVGERRIPDMRMKQVEEAGADCVAVACPGCTAMLEGVTNASARVRDIAELLEQSVRLEA
jgi:Fe-S oxidoreductase